MVCLDMCFLIDLLRGKASIADLRETFDRKETNFTVATPSVMELWAGLLLSQHSEKEKIKVLELFRSLTILPLDEQSAKHAAEYEAMLVKKGKPIGTEDLMIAGIVSAHGEVLVTRDEHYASIPGLRLLKY
ncbi:type II toxin-antitoxin system VapC family toxin [Candidatus Woesearchaeota archaeon]|nr:type II toxin-antitoxin system VapC family toxin [Candidatus Woesearchaeota archaeon]